MQLLPPWYFHALSLALGLVVGSFLNVVVARLPHGQSIVRPRSRCPQCGAGIAAYDNVPVLSWLILRGKCRGCRAPISPRYPLIELLTGVLFLAAEVHVGWTPWLLVRDFPLMAILVAVTFIDLEHRIIPDVLSLGGLALGLAVAFLPDGIGLSSPIGAAVGFSAFFALAWGYERWSGRSGLGGGDIKLLAMLGAFIGPMGVLNTIIISSISGSVVGLGWGLLRRLRPGTPALAEAPAPEPRPPADAGDAVDGDEPAAESADDLMSLAIPFGPFLVLGALYYYLIGDLLWPPFTNPM